MKSHPKKLVGMLRRSQAAVIEFIARLLKF